MEPPQLPPPPSSSSSSTAPKRSSRKRPRKNPVEKDRTEPGVAKSGVQHESNEDPVENATTPVAPSCTPPPPPPLLTPHTLRLLKLIQDGTAEHAQMAAVQLRRITQAEHCPPVVLWEIMGRLQAFLVSREWNTRRNASVALEGVAQHLPFEDQQEFLQAQTRPQQQHQQQQGTSNMNEKKSNNSNQKNDDLTTWLRLDDVKENLSTILEKGRLLLSTTESQYELEAQTEDAQLVRLAQDSPTDNGAQDFCQRRLEMQRAILARRLGLSETLIHYTDSGHDLLKSQLTQEDLFPGSSKPSGKKGEQKLSKKKRRSKKDDFDNDDQDNRTLSIGSLLVTQIRQQATPVCDKAERNSSPPPLSHRNAQSLLAGELVYRMFDSSWHVRHGSLMGIRALVRAWNVHDNNCRHHGIDPKNGIKSTQSPSPSSCFGHWPHDILARAVCVLALDRFGDFSGASSELSSSSMVAPIRESAAQVFSVLFFMAPESEQQQAIDLLKLLLQDDEWEVKHGALLAIKYVMVLMETTPNLKEEWQQDFLSQVLPLAISGLKDRSDDISSVSAQIIGICFQRGRHQALFDGAIVAVWNVLLDARLYSISVPDLVACLSKFLAADSDCVLHAISIDGNKLHGYIRILARLNDLLGCEYVSVKTSIVTMIGSLLSSLGTQLEDPISSQVFRTGIVANAVTECFSRLVEKVFSLRLLYSVIDANACENSHYATLLVAIDDTWILLSKISALVFVGNEPERSKVEINLLLLCFGIRNVNESKTGASLQGTSMSLSGQRLRAAVDNAKAVANFLCTEHTKISNHFSTEGDAEFYNVLEFLLLCCVASPLVPLCQTACFVIQSLSARIDDQSENERSSMGNVFELCKEGLHNLFDEGAPCVRVQSFSPEMVMQSLSQGLNSVQQGTSGRNAASVCISSWKAPSVKNAGANLQTTAESMRIVSTIVGTLVALGHSSLPTKLTPIVQPLMTSIQNEHEEVNMLQNCYYVEHFLGILMGQAPPERAVGFQRTAAKILENLCDLVASRIEPGSIASSRILGSLVGNLNSEKELFLFDPVWSKISPLLKSENISLDTLCQGMSVLKAACQFLHLDRSIASYLLNHFVPHLVKFCCDVSDSSLRDLSWSTLKTMCLVDDRTVLDNSIPILLIFLQDTKRDDRRVSACALLQTLLDDTKSTASLCRSVRVLLPIVMPLMADPVRRCAETAACIFSRLVVVAPLVEQRPDTTTGKKDTNDADMVIEHLVHGKPLPLCDMQPTILQCLDEAGVVLRDYQQEGVSWLRFLQRVKLNGALCDSMGLGKTVQALVAVALSHLDQVNGGCKTLIVCPSSLVGHWVNEIHRFFPRKRIFAPLALVGNRRQRDSLWATIDSINLLVTSYSVLRSDVDNLASIDWQYCVLDEGHLLRNPKTLTAKASRRLRSRHRLILTGTPIQNTVNEVWATFDFLMPNFLGTSNEFSKKFAKPISKGQKLDSAAVDVALGMEKLRLLHQQVLPFILRREKDQVLKELPPKIITRIPCVFSPMQQQLYHQFCSGEQAKRSLMVLQNAMQHTGDINAKKSRAASFSADVLKSLLYLRLLCTHPCLVRGRSVDQNFGGDKSFRLEGSGKLVALVSLLRQAGVDSGGLTAADNDSSLFYCDDADDAAGDADDFAEVLDNQGVDASLSAGYLNDQTATTLGSRCLIFAQFTHSLDIVEELVLRRHMPSVKYLRLDGRTPACKRSGLVDRFNQDDTIQLMLLTTKIGGLGLNLTGADTVIFLEHDWNPQSDLQAMDRAHRIGQTKSVHVYQLVTADSIEEKMMQLHEKKLAMSSAIVNTDNSSMYSLGTDRLLDIFQFRGSGGGTAGTSAGFETTLDAMVERYQDEYRSLSLDDFLAGFQSTSDD